MDVQLVDRLLKKVQRAAEELIDLKDANRKLQSELDLLRQQLKEHQTLQKDNDRYRRDFDRLRTRLGKLHKKVEKALVMSPVGAGREASNEEHPQ
ncbi:MAG: hypothetical protein JO102_06765 [Elusimicrobia bacterium]|nr:hypothetical protein [Elusimicrobiota bacterium]